MSTDDHSDGAPEPSQDANGDKSQAPLDPIGSDHSPENRKPGAQPGNQNALRHGLDNGTWAKRFKHIENAVNRWRAKNVEPAVVDAFGKITLNQATIIQTACEWEGRRKVIRWWLRHESSLTSEQFINYTREAAKAAEERSKCISSLGLGCDRAADPAAALRARRSALPASLGVSAGDDTPETRPDTASEPESNGDTEHAEAATGVPDGRTADGIGESTPQAP